MGCNCGKNQIQYQYVYTSATGAKKVYYKEIEARAAVIRSGGNYVTLPK